MEGCFPCKLRTVQVAPSATPTRAPGVAETNMTEKRWAVDMPAYKRLRDNGLQPPHIDGSAELEARSEVAEHVESGHPEWPVEAITRAEDHLERKVTEPRTESGVTW